jgi:hypothetical protein
LKHYAKIYRMDIAWSETEGPFDTDTQARKWAKRRMEQIQQRNHEGHEYRVTFIRDIEVFAAEGGAAS